MNDHMKFFVAAAAAAVWAYASNLIIPLGVLIFVMIVDYISGVSAAWKKGELNSRIGLVGIIKKLSYLALVVVGCTLDYLITMISDKVAGDEITVKAIGLVVICWLIVNELISILENVAKAGGPVPPFLLPLLARLKQNAETAVPAIPAAAPEQSEARHE